MSVLLKAFLSTLIYANNFVNSLLKSNKNYVVIYPNNDLGSKYIIKAYDKLINNNRFKIHTSIRFEYFLVLLKKAQFIIGNSSAGIREAPYYGIPTINIGTRQENRALHSHIINTSYNSTEISDTINSNLERVIVKTESFGIGNSATQFLKSLNSEKLWNLNHQKQFKDI